LAHHAIYYNYTTILGMTELFAIYLTEKSGGSKTYFSFISVGRKSESNPDDSV